jgi:hypothetical protein
MKYEKLVGVYNTAEGDSGEVPVSVTLDLTPEQSKELRKQMKVAEKVARGE